MAAEFVVLGARGRLGGEFLRVLGPRALGLDHAQLPLEEVLQHTALWERLRPRVVINCAAFNHVDRAETRHEQALAANARGPAQLAALADAMDFRLVHFSTDYVFGGDGLDRPRRETDPPAPVNFYGYSKLLGEQAVLQSRAQALVLRVANLYAGRSPAPGRASLVERFLAQARAGRPISVTRRQWLNPTSVRALVPAVLLLLERRATGVFHLAGEGGCEAATFARAICRMAGLTPKLRFTVRDARPAARARHTVLANARWAELGLPPLPDWQMALHEALAAAS
ncbi:MAG: SDR family oxidoreductase [Terriglobales bacterium]